MQIHELNTFSGTPGANDYFATDNGADTSKISAENLLAPLNERIDNIIAGPAPSAEEIVDARLGADGVTYPSLGDAIRDQVTDLKSELNDNTNFTAQMNVIQVNTGTATMSGLSVPYSIDAIEINGTSNSSNSSAFISDSYTLPAGDYVLSDGRNASVDDCDIRILNSSNVTLANSVTSPTFTLSEPTSVKTLLYIFKNQTFDNISLKPYLYKDIGILSNESLTKFVETNPEINAGENVAVLKNGTWSSLEAGLSASFDTEKVVVNGTALANASFFITDSFTLEAGSYYLFDGLESHDGTIRLGVMNSSNVTLAWADTASGAFTLDSNTSVKILVYVYKDAVLTNFTMYPEIVSQESLSNKRLTESIRGLIGYPITTINNAIGRSGYYPWRFGCPWDSKKAQFYNCIKNISLFGAKAGNEYYIRNIYVNSSALNPKGTYITIYDKSGTKVCEYSSLTVPTSRQVLHFVEFSDSGISALVDADFAGVPDGFAPSMTSYSELGISDACIVGADGEVEILCPDNIYAVVGLETNLYWDSLIKCGNIDNVVVEVTGNGLNLGNRWSYTPLSAGSFSITIKVRDLAYRLLAIKTVTITASAYAAGNATTINAIHLGDSMIDNDYHLAHLQSNMANSNITYNILGTRPHSEGRGGWTSSQYLQLAENGGVVNAFFNPSTQTFDFSYYMANQGYPTPDVVFIFLGTNDVKGTTQFTGIEGATNITIKNLNTIIASIHDFDSSIKICINTAGIGANDQYPYAKMYGDNRIKQALHKYGIQAQTSKMLQTYSNREDENIYVVPTGTSLDNVHGFPTTNVNASARITEQITVQSDCYHPTSEGYHQFADCEFAFIRNNLL